MGLCSKQNQGIIFVLNRELSQFHRKLHKHRRCYAIVEMSIVYNYMKMLTMLHGLCLPLLMFVSASLEKPLSDIEYSI